MPVEFLNDIAKLLKMLGNEQISEETEYICKSIKEQLIAKLERIEKREAFTEYKIATRSSEEREEKRQTYLKKAGIQENFKSEKEIHYFEK